MNARFLLSSALRYRWVVWSLLVATYMVSFFHRMAVSVVKEPLMRQFDLSVSEFGMLASMYFYAYCFAQIPSGIMADSLGVGSCWIQGRLRRTPEEETTEEYVRRCLGFPEKFRLEAILSLGMPAAHGAGTELSALPMEKVHDGKF